ncbi:MAG: 2-oxoglutarate dehydrogenase complex dihydrolipoyllysine-residue succinyltransferase [Sphingomonas sp.]|uniref:2-oxoglutarate dehydrogenase complex dihydrolipoyllysine-residue succinyltransferase n=1 Tax=Sphingomonas sp. TaxID=28214 RepID=UPI0017D3A3BE|nr:2-oxoglutarate dehydrogenase complex dihydrolipoyllysine-residue succinyltransferase [Sphingomonas sp.]MBA3666546.1 2-oxoglutarate dehydrogenase complex dihydrolipoyllysine-residue succinyltransferase [Sphingomonas sp.]
MATDVKVPTLGESITEATIGQWLKAPGDAVALDEPIVSLETDKVAVEVPSPVAGTLAEQLGKEGDTVAVGAIIARVGDGGAAVAAPAEASEAPTNPAGPAETPLPRDDEHAPEQVPEQAPSAAVATEALTLSPAVRRAVLELHVDPSAIKGSGKDGRLTKDDVLAAAKVKDSGSPAQAGAQAPEAKAPASPDLKPAAPGPRPLPGNEERREERVKMTRMRQTIATRLKEAQNTAALLTTFNDVDMSAVIDARARYKDLFEKKHGIRLGFMGFFVKAVALAAKDVPSVNARIEGDEIVYHDYLDVSVAVSAPKGLVVPVVRNADRMSFAEIEKAIAAYGKKAKDGALTAEDMKGGTFTISNGGVFGSLMSTPIINPPQSAVLGMHRIEDRPVAKDGQVVIRPMMYLALSYDHRLIDGREAVTFLVRVKEAIEDPTRLLIDL